MVDSNSWWEACMALDLGAFLGVLGLDDDDDHMGWENMFYGNPEHGEKTGSRGLVYMYPVHLYAYLREFTEFLAT